MNMKFRFRLFLCLLIFAFSLCAKHTAPQLAQKTKNVLFGNGDDPVTQACIAFTRAASEGESIRGSVYAFCNELYEKR